MDLRALCLSRISIAPDDEFLFNFVSPILISSELGSRVIVPCPTDKIPVILASPSTRRAVVAVPVLTTIPFLNVPTPRESTLVTSSYVRVPAIETLPVAVILVTVISGEPVRPVALLPPLKAVLAIPTHFDFV